jgi:hypothetical protein
MVCGTQGASCSVQYPQGIRIGLEAQPAAGWRFAGWTGDADCADGEVTVNGPVTCEASFVK